MAIKLTTEQFIDKAKQVHGDKYTYELVVYTHSQNKVKINCPIHGVFIQAPSEHLRGKSCSLCTGNESRQTKAASEFVSKAREIHGDKYDYSFVDYVNAHTKIKIGCPIHGIFEQRASHHISSKTGCPHCAREEKGWTRTQFKAKCDKNNNGLGILYVLECFNDSESFIKIGITSNSIKKRYNSKTSMPYAYRVIDEIIGDPEYIFDLETEMHQQHKEHRYEPNIPFGGSLTECFKTNNTNN